jgi:hypothetical protein
VLCLGVNAELNDHRQGPAVRENLASSLKLTRQNACRGEGLSRSLSDGVYAVRLAGPAGTRACALIVK